MTASDTRRRLTIEEFHAELRAQGVPMVHLAFRCPRCKTVQSMQDLIDAGVGADVVETYIGFSCVGRFDHGLPSQEPGPSRSFRRGPATPASRGCDWTLGGLFQIHALEVVTPDGKEHARFEVCTPEEAQAHARANGWTPTAPPAAAEPVAAGADG